MTKTNSMNAQNSLDLREVTSKDFDGHTAFAEMTAEQRLLWLSHAAEFIMQARNLKIQTDEIE